MQTRGSGRFLRTPHGRRALSGTIRRTLGVGAGAAPYGEYAASSRGWRRGPLALRQDQALPYLLLIPSLALFVGLLIYPLLYSAWLSLHQWEFGMPLSTMGFVGIKNYRSFLHDEFFWHSLWVTTQFTFGTISIELTVSMITALILSRAIAGINVIRALVILPMMVSPAIVGMVFRMLFNTMFGWVNYFLTGLGVPPVDWLSNPKVVLWTVISVEAWRRIPFVTLIFLAGLSALPKSPYESAVVDGATGFQTFTKITLPLLRPLIIFAVLIRMMDAFRTFDLLYTLTAGGPGTLTETLSLYAYRNAFFEGAFARGAALSWVLLVLMILASFLLTQTLYKEYEL